MLLGDGKQAAWLSVARSAGARHYFVGAGSGQATLDHYLGAQACATVTTDVTFNRFIGDALMSSPFTTTVWSL